MQIVVVDNGSTDDTTAQVRASYPSVELIRLPKNVGINRGYNTGIEKALAGGAEYVVVMNNDTSVHPRMLKALKSALEANPNAGVAVPKIAYYDDPKRLWSAGARWRSFPPGVKLIGLDKLDGPEFSTLKEIEFATSCCLCIRSQVLRDAGLFDPTYIFYYDDWDFAIQVRRKGYRIIYVPQAFLRHKVSVTTQKANRSGYWSKVMGRDSAYFYLRNIGWASLALMTFWAVARDVVQGSFRDIPFYVQGVLEGVESTRRRGIELEKGRLAK